MVEAVAGGRTGLIADRRGLNSDSSTPLPVLRPTPFVAGINPEVPGRIGDTRSARAARRAGMAYDQLARCEFCAHRCGVNRLAGEMGPCRAGIATRAFHAQVEVGDEQALTPVFAVSLSGCDLRCNFCVTGRQSWDATAGEEIYGEGGPTPALLGLATRARRALDAGARSVMILGGEPTLHLPAALEFAAHLPDHATLVWKTNAHGTAQARALLADVFDVWVADYKFGNDGCASRMAGIPEYTAIVRGNLRWARAHARLIVRHLLMPGHVDCCWRPVAEWLAADLPGVEVSLRDGFWPGWFSSRHPELAAPVSSRDLRRAREIADELGLHTIS